MTVSPATDVWPTATRGAARLGQEDIDARAEADEAEALADRDVAAGLGPADDAARDEAGDLHDGDRAVRAFDDEAVALVLLARLVELGIEEFSGPVFDPR